MNAVMPVFLSLSFSGSILALILLILMPLIKNKLSQTWQYYIWLIVILRFLLPFTPQVSVVGEISRQIQSMGNTHTTVYKEPEVNTEADYITTKSPIIIEPVRSPQANVTEASPKIKAPLQFDFLSDIIGTLRLLWISVALALLVHKVSSYRSFVRFVNVGAKIATDTHILDIYKDTLAKSNVKKQLPLYINNQVVSPMLVGIIRPAIIIPLFEVTDDEIRHVFQHELTHYKRLDFLYKWIVQITLCLHWFNPIVHLINKQINKSCELSCDEFVIKQLDEDNRLTYGDALIASLQAQGNYSDFVVSMTMSENGNIIKERLDAIMIYKKKSFITAIMSAALAVAIFFGATFTGAYAADGFDNSLVNPNEKMSRGFFDDPNPTDNPAYPYRLTIPELPTDLLGWIDESNQTSDIFIVSYNERYFIYCNSIPGDFSWQPSLGSTTVLELFDIAGEGDSYALLSLPLCDTLTVMYNNVSVTASNNSVVHITTKTSPESSIKIIAEGQQNGDNQSMVYTKATVQFAISNITGYAKENIDSWKYGYVCLGQIPNINNAKHITYTIDKDSGSGLFVGMSTDDKSITNQYQWYNFHSNSGSGIDIEFNDPTGTAPRYIGYSGYIGKDPEYFGKYYLYVGTTGTSLTNVKGTITVEY